MAPPSRPLAVPWLAVGLAWLAIAGHATAEPVAIEAIRDAGVERLRMTWASPVGFSASAIDGLLTLTFDRPVDADLRAVATLTRLAGPPRLSDDRRSLLLPLNPHASALSYADDRIVFVDLLAAAPAKTAEKANPPDKPPAPASAPAPAQPPAPNPPPVRIRYGEHPGYSRVVFDWPADVGYRIERSGDTATITFDRAERLDAAKAGRRPSRIRDLKIIPGGSEVAVALTTAGADAIVRDFRLGSKVVVDVMAADSKAASGDAVAAAPSPPVSADATAVISPPPLPTARPKPPETQADQPPAPPAATASPEPKKELSPTVVTLPPPRPSDEIASAPEKPPERPLPPAGQLRFDWQQPVAAAVFRRSGRLWVAFDAPSQPNLAALAAASGGAVTAIRQLPVANATVLHIETVNTAPPRLLRAGHTWIVAFEEATATAPEPLVPMPEPQAAGGPRLVVAVAAPGRPITFGDPDIGDTLIVVPTVPLGRGLNRHYRYPMFEMLPTQQGIVVAPLIDSLTVDAQRDGVVVGSRAGLSLSALPESIRASTKLAPPPDITPTIDLKRWAEFRPAEFITHRQALTREAGLANGTARTPARLALAGFYLGHGLAAEALGEATVIANSDKEAAVQPAVRLLTGAAQLLQGRVDDARRVLNDPVLDGLDEAALWRTAADAAASKTPPGTTVPFDRHGAVLLGYPRPLRAALSPLLIEAALAAGQLQPAQHLLTAARADAPPAADAALLDVLEGRVRLAAGDRAGAREAFARAAAGPSPKAEAFAEAELVEMELKQGSLKTAEAIERLDRLRFTWRGDSFEAKLLLRLSQLTAELGDYSGALRTLRQITSNFRGRAEAAAAAERMTAMFQSLYLDGAAERMPPVAAVGLYNEFRELTPPGEKGRRIVLGLAERLIALELPGSAASLLEPALNAATDAQGRVELGTALARAEDQAGHPEAVLAALTRSDADPIVDSLLTTRRRLEAKALIDLGRHDDALAVLAQFGGREAAKLRADVYRRKGDWAAASRLLGEQLAADSDGEVERASQRLDLGVARALAGNTPPPAAPPVSTDPPSAPEEPAMRLLNGDGIGITADRAAIDRAVDEAVRFRDALKAPTPPPPDTAKP